MQTSSSSSSGSGSGSSSSSHSMHISSMFSSRAAVSSSIDPGAPAASSSSLTHARTHARTHAHTHPSHLPHTHLPPPRTWMTLAPWSITRILLNTSSRISSTRLRSSAFFLAFSSSCQLGLPRCLAAAAVLVFRPGVVAGLALRSNQGGHALVTLQAQA
ncbi:MAG: hypothetical protein WDW38_004774 [Sanguina aurantia]